MAHLNRTPSIMNVNRPRSPWQTSSHLIKFIRSGLLFQVVKILVILWLAGFLLVKINRFWSNISPNGSVKLYGVAIGLVLFASFFGSLLFYVDPFVIGMKDPEARKKRPLVSCMVAVYNEERIIEQCVKSLLSQTYSNKEIIIVNDCSKDKTGDILDRYARQGQIKVIHLEKNAGKKRALGRAMLEAKGEVFAFTDSDSVWADDAIEKVVIAMNADPMIGAISGHCRALNAKTNLITRIQDSWYEGQFSIRKAFESLFGAVTCVSGPLAVFRREAVYNYIPAWENDTFLGQEFRFATDRTMTGFVLGAKSIDRKLKARYADSPFVKSVNYETRNWKVVYCKAAKSWTNVPDSLDKVLKQQIRWKKSFIRNVFFTGSFYWRRPFLPVVFYYLHVLFVLAGPFITFRYLIYHPLMGDFTSAFMYLAGILSVGFCFGLACMIEDPDCPHWYYRPLMSVMSTLMLSWIVFYSAATIKKNIWARG